VKTNPQAYDWDFDGACSPTGCCGLTGYPGQETFSVGIFQWIPRTGVRKGLKKGKVTERIRGRVQEAERVYARAQARVAELDNLRRIEKA